MTHTNFISWTSTFKFNMNFNLSLFSTKTVQYMFYKIQLNIFVFSPGLYLETLLEVNLNFQVQLSMILANSFCAEKTTREFRS